MIKIKKFSEINEEALPRKRSVEQLKKLRKLSKGTDIGDRIPDLKKQGANIHFYQNPIDTGIESYEDFEKNNKKFIPSWNFKKKIGPFNESVESDEYSYEIQTIRNVLTELKDEYEYIDGVIIPPIKVGYHFHISIYMKDLSFKGKEYSLDLIKNKKNFIDFMIKIIERLELATHMKSKTIGLFQWADCDWRAENSTIQIYLR